MYCTFSNHFFSFNLVSLKVRSGSLVFDPFVGTGKLLCLLFKVTINYLPFFLELMIILTFRFSLFCIWELITILFCCQVACLCLALILELM